MKDALSKFWKDSGLIKSDVLLKAFLEVPREDFISQAYAEHAYDDHPLPTLAGQTISQPTTMMIMIDALELRPEDVVLEIGAGTGYSAAVMSRMCKSVYTAEILTELIGLARKNIEQQGIENVEVMRDDGTLEFHMKFDKIVVTCACPAVPKPLIDQLNDDGVLVLPVGPKTSQSMIKITKRKGKMQAIELGDFVFVPLQGIYAYR